MSIVTMLKGVSLGLFVSASIMVLNSSPVIEVYPSSEIVTAEFEYSRFMPLPELILGEGHQDEPIYKEVRRITLLDGTPGIRMVVLFDDDKPDPNFI